MLSRIKTENRNIFVAPLKKGRGPDVYFSPVEPESLDTIEKYKQMNEEDKKVMRALEEEILNEYDIKRG